MRCKSPYLEEATYKIGPQKANGGLCVERVLWFGGRVFNLLNLVKILFDTSQLLEDVVILGIRPIQAQGR